MTGKIDGVDWAQSLLTLHDGRIAVAYYGDSGQMISIIDTEKRALGDSFPMQGELSQMVSGGGDYDLYYTNGVNFFGYKLETGKPEKLFNWINCDVDNSNINGSRKGQHLSDHDGKGAQQLAAAEGSPHARRAVSGLGGPPADHQLQPQA